MALLFFFFQIEFAYSARPNIISSSGKSDVVQNRGRWSIDPTDTMYELAGNWKILTSNLDLSGTINLPFAWYGKEGFVHITRTFILPADGINRSWRLVIDGTSLETRVVVNGVNIDSRRGKNLSYQLDLGIRTLRFGEQNEISITLDNSYKSNAPPVRGSIYTPMNYGGIYRGIYLVSSPLIRLNDILVKRVADSGNDQIEIDISTEIRKFERDGNLDSGNLIEYDLFVSISDERRGTILNGKVDRLIIPPIGIYHKSFRIVIPNRLQNDNSNRNPRFSAELSLKGDGGLHQITTDFYLSSPNKLINDVRCINYVVSDPINGPIIPLNNLNTDVRLLLQAGANTVKISQAGQIPHFLDQCAQQGLDVLLELPVFQVPNGFLSDENFIQSSLDQMTSMIDRDGRYACVTGWGIGGDIEPPNENNIRYYTRLIDHIHNLDHRPVFASVNWSNSAELLPLDFCIIDYEFIDSYDGTKIRLKDAKYKILIDGIGSLVMPGNFSGWQDPSSEINQANNIIEKLKNISNLNGYHGVVVGDFLDWRGNIPTISGPLMGTTNIYSNGIITGSRQPRPSYRSLSNYWKFGKSEPLPQGNYVASDGSIMVIIGLLLIFVLIVMARQNNIFRFNIHRTFASPSGFFQDIKEHRYFQTGHSLLLAIFISAALGMTIAGWSQANRSSFALDWIIGYIFRSNFAVEWLATILWNPIRGVLFFLVASLFWLWSMILQFKFTGLILQRKCTISQSIDLTIWSSVVIAGLLPIGLTSARLFNSNLGWILFFFSTILILWAQLRLLYVYTTYFCLRLYTAIWWWILPTTAIFMLILIVLNNFHAIFIYWRFIIENIIR